MHMQINHDATTTTTTIAGHMHVACGMCHATQPDNANLDAPDKANPSKTKSIIIIFKRFFEFQR